ncbi:putative choline dehydrogenase [Delitschia confertaspora ATCC 74209]|uniref:Choline dehydrogenase n=1 Tax=Delitschia confertaspora ATCC 74209 TaxID=1513339 RepID=A0A9P4JRS7_9PLEO|nr:putative choline dehydrogenase [Delitschia confertaspora ATCC 74209]
MVPHFKLLPPFRRLLIVLFIFPLLALSSEPSSISGQQLLGSSFGIPGLNATFTHVIIGGGTAGLVLANRLSAFPENRVAVIEAGSFYELSNGNQSQIPRFVWNGAGVGFLDVNPLVDWNFATTQQPGINNISIHYARGRALGGCSARNHMVYHRATKGAYAKWAEEVLDETYRWENFRKYLDKSITFHEADMSKRPSNTTPSFDPAGQTAKSGPVSVAYSNFVLSFSSWLMAALHEVGLKPIPGFLGGELVGTSWYTRTVDRKTQTRESSETAYLRPVLQRTNLVVYQLTMATKVLFDGKKNAVGVECSCFGKTFYLNATREVILSAGALQSPQLLMISGIGPRSMLERFGIQVLVDSPGVGQGMPEHPVISVTRRVNLIASTVLNTPAKNEAAIRDYLNNATGPLTSTGGDIVGWEKVPRRLISNATAAFLDTFPSDWPDLEFLTGSTYPGTPPDNSDYAAISVAMVATASRGSVTISSASALDPPVIDLGLLADPIDQDIAIAAVKRARELFATSALSPILIDEESVPGPNITTDAQILAFIRSSARTVSHVSCTCKMGKKGDNMAVVDSKGRVFGTGRLRVLDASAMPFLVPGHPMATVYGVAEMIVEDIIQENKEW